MPKAKPKVFLNRRYYFRSIHKIAQEDFIHGHDYYMDLTVENSKTPWWTSRDELDQIIEKDLLAKLDRAWINDFVEPATGECLVDKAFKLVAEKLPGHLKLIALNIHETRRNTFTAFNPSPSKGFGLRL